jgi:two-component system CheB/CheR fusion protein
MENPMATPPEDGELETLLEYINERRNFDFRGYKRASLTRRIFKRMQALDVDDYEQYMEMLEANPGEFADLFNTILINVTAFLRDPDAWAALAGTVIPQIVGAKGPDDPVRVWSAGCASGEEAYSLAVLLAEAFGEDRFRQAVKIYATDADNDALADARRGRYRYETLVEAFGEERARRFFDTDGEDGIFRTDLRRALIFGRHDLVQDPPISRIDLLTCRNTLMYFTAEVQVKILASFQFALNPGGYLFLGRSEALVTRTQMFEVVDLPQHILRKEVAGAGPEAVPPPPARPGGPPRLDGHRPIEALFEQNVVAQVMLDASGNIAAANRAARRMFSIGSADLGRQLREAELYQRPADLRTPIERAQRERRPMAVYDVPWQGQDELRALDIIVSPLDGPTGLVISFLDATRYQHLRADLEDSRRELKTAYEELQSTVEELETTNEEFQSTNEELETINNELRDRSSEVTELNQFLQSILGSFQSAVVVLGTGMEVRAWNRQAEDLWGLRADEVLNQHFLNLDIGFPVEQLRGPIRSLLAGRAEQDQLTCPAINRRGRPVECTVTLSQLVGAGTTRGVILVMDAVARETAS